MNTENKSQPGVWGPFQLNLSRFQLKASSAGKYTAMRSFKWKSAFVSEEIRVTGKVA
jgi:hypothetical protein